jgi:hypothetical protein
MMVEAAGCFETSAYVYQPKRLYIPEDMDIVAAVCERTISH